MNSKTLKLIGILSTVLGAGVALLGGWVEEQKMKEAVHEEALSGGWVEEQKMRETVREEIELALSAREV